MDSYIKFLRAKKKYYKQLKHIWKYKKSTK
jgi:hypothetical protein